MASINGLTVKKIKYFEGTEGTAAQGDLYLGNKKIAFWSQDADGCIDDNLDMEPGYSETRLRQAIIAAHPEKHEEKIAQNGVPYTLDYELEFLMTDLLSRMETEKAWKRAVKAGYAGLFEIADGFHVSRWKLSKSLYEKGARTLSHAAKSNATFWEWMQCPLILDRLRFMEQLKNAARPYFAEKPILYANMRMLQSFRKEAMSGRKQAKNCLGIMRTAMQAIYAMQYRTAPPVDIVTLINQTVLPGTQNAEECRKLLELCKSGHGDAPYTLTCELASSIDDRIRLWLNGHPKQEKRDLKTLDEFFQSMVL